MDEHHKEYSLNERQYRTWPTGLGSCQDKESGRREQQKASSYVRQDKGEGVNEGWQCRETLGYYTHKPPRPGEPSLSAHPPPPRRERMDGECPGAYIGPAGGCAFNPIRKQGYARYGATDANERRRYGRAIQGDDATPIPPSPSHRPADVGARAWVRGTLGGSG